MRCRVKASVDYPLRCSFPPPPRGFSLTVPHLSSVDILPPLFVRPSISGVLSQFTLILMGTGPSAANPSSFDFPRPSNNSCKTFDAQQICIGETWKLRALLQLNGLSRPAGSQSLLLTGVRSDRWEKQMLSIQYMFDKLPRHLNTLTICRLSYAVIVKILLDRMEKQQGRRAKGAMLTTEEEAGSFILLPSFSASLTSCLLAASFWSF